MSRLVRLYPAAWRTRYGDEFARLIEERPPSPLDRIDILRGALDAQLHPHVLVGGPEPAPWTHRLPGLLAAGAGLAMSSAIVSIAVGSGGDWGVAESFVGAALMLMLLSLPGDYLAGFGRRIALVLAGLGASVIVVNGLGWTVPAFVLGGGAYLVAICGLLTAAAIRAGIGARGRWLLLAASVLLPILVIAGIGLLRAVAGIVLLPGDSPFAVFSILPYGLAWLLVGTRMAVRGSPTIIDAPVDPSPAREVQPA
jgi:hypothetical protein